MHPMSYIAGCTETRRHDAVAAEVRAAQWLARGNEAAERGDKDRAERCYAKSTYWLTRANTLLGNG